MHEASVKLLNQAVGDELYAVHQYDTEYGQQYLALQSIERSRNISGGATAE